MTTRRENHFFYCSDENQETIRRKILTSAMNVSRLVITSSSTQADEVQLVSRQILVKKDNSFSLYYQENCLGRQCFISPSIFVSTHWMLLFTVPNDSMGLRRALFTISGVLYELVHKNEFCLKMKIVLT